MIGPCDVKTMTGTPVGVREDLLSKPDLPVCYQDSRQFAYGDLLDLLFDVTNGATRLKSGTDYAEIAAILILTNERFLEEMNGSSKV